MREMKSESTIKGKGLLGVCSEVLRKNNRNATTYATPTPSILASEF
jgi:hypothetical protein